MVLGEPLPVEEPEIFYRVLTLTQALTKYQLAVDRIYFDGPEHMTLYFGKVKIVFGTDELLDEKMGLIQSLLPDLEGKEGTMSLENYDGDSNFRPIFKPDS